MGDIVTRAFNTMSEVNNRAAEEGSKVVKDAVGKVAGAASSTVTGIAKKVI